MNWPPLVNGKMAYATRQELFTWWNSFVCMCAQFCECVCTLTLVSEAEVIRSRSLCFFPHAHAQGRCSCTKPEQHKSVFRAVKWSEVTETFIISIIWHISTLQNYVLIWNQPSCHSPLLPLLTVLFKCNSSLFPSLLSKKNKNTAVIEAIYFRILSNYHYSPSSIPPDRLPMPTSQQAYHSIYPAKPGTPKKEKNLLLKKNNFLCTRF